MLSRAKNNTDERVRLFSHLFNSIGSGSIQCHLYHRGATLGYVLFRNNVRVLAYVRYEKNNVWPLRHL